MIDTKVIVYDEIVRRKLLAAAPRILARNRELVATMLKEIKPIVEVQTPVGPGHFGYHGRDTLKTDVKSEGVKTTGELRAAIQLYWRERGTKRGERARKVAHKAAAVVRRFINFYYGKGGWWNT